MSNLLKFRNDNSFQLLEAMTKKNTSFDLDDLLDDALSMETNRNKILDYCALSFYISQKDLLITNNTIKAVNEALDILCSELVVSKKSHLKRESHQRLPRLILKNATREERLIHEAVFSPDKVLSGLDSLKYLAVSYFPQKRDFFYVCLSFLLLTVPGLNSLLLGLACGYFFSSIIEHYAHLHIGHGSLGNSKKSSWFWDKFSRFYLEHSVHHGSVKLNYVQPFAKADFSGSTQDTQYIASRLKRARFRAYNKGGASLVNDVIKSEYGLRSSSTFRSHYSFAPITIMALLLMLPIFGLLPLSTVLIFSLGFLALAQLWVPTSEYFHSFLHSTREDAVNKTESIFMKWFLGTRLATFTARLHKVHHDIQGKYNQNLNLGYGLVIGWKPLKLRGLIELIKKDAIY